jgi:hypothetical protein
MGLQSEKGGLIPEGLFGRTLRGYIVFFPCCELRRCLPATDIHPFWISFWDALHALAQVSHYIGENPSKSPIFAIPIGATQCKSTHEFFLGVL